MQIREVEGELRRPIALPADLQGPKLRVGAFVEDPVMLATGSPFRFDTTIADLSVSSATAEIRPGSLCRPDRVAKYSRQLLIEQELGKGAA